MLVAAMLACGVDPNRADVQRATPLHVAVDLMDRPSGRFIVSLLVKAGGDLQSAGSANLNGQVWFLSCKRVSMRVSAIVFWNARIYLDAMLLPFDANCTHRFLWSGRPVQIRDHFCLA
jgi:hypothetical protein